MTHRPSFAPKSRRRFTACVSLLLVAVFFNAQTTLQAASPGAAAIFTGSGGGITTTATPHTFGTTVRSDAGISLTGSNVSLDAGNYFVLYNSKFTSSSGGNRSEIQTNLQLNGNNQAIGYSQAYIRRDTGQFDTITSGAGILNVASSGTNLSLQSQRTDSNGAGVVRGTTGLQVLKLDDSWSYFNASRGSDQTGPAGASVEVTYDSSSITNGGFTFNATTGEVDLIDGGKYLVVANTYVDTGGTNQRNSFTQQLSLDGTAVDGTQTTVYLRGGTAQSSNEGAAAVASIIDATAGQKLNVSIAPDGGSVASTIKAGKTALSIVKLPDSADYIRLTETGGTVELNDATAPVTWGTQPEPGAPAFSHTAGASPVTVNSTDDFLFLSSLYTNNGNSQRAYPEQTFHVDGSATGEDFGQSGFYNRGLSDGAGAGRDGGNFGGAILSLDSGQTVEVRTTPTGSGDTTQTLLDQGGFQGVALGSAFNSATWDADDEPAGTGYGDGEFNGRGLAHDTFSDVGSPTVTGIAAGGFAQTGNNTTIEFNGTDRFTADSWGDPSASAAYGAGGSQDATFEFFLSPTTLNGGNQVIFESGGAVDGMGIVLRDNQLELGVNFNSVGGSEANTGVTVDLNQITTSGSTDYLRVRANLNTSTSDGYALITVENLGTGATTYGYGDWRGGDWSGTDDAGLGGLNGSLGGSGGGILTEAYGTFNGQIAQVNFFNENLLDASSLKFWRGGDPPADTAVIGWQDPANWYSDLAGSQQVPTAGDVPGADDIVMLHTTNAPATGTNNNDRQDVIQLNGNREVRGIVALPGATFNADSSTYPEAGPGDFVIRRGSGSLQTLTLNDANAIDFQSDGTQTNRTLFFDGSGSGSAANGDADLFFTNPTGAIINVAGSTDTVDISFDINNASGDNAAQIIKTGDGNLTLSGPRANGYTGNWVVDGGTLELNKTNNVISVAGDVTVNTGGTLQVNTTGQFNVNNTDITVDGGTFDLRGSGFRGSVNSLHFLAGTVTDGDGTINSQLNVRKNANDALLIRGGLDIPIRIALDSTNQNGLTFDATNNGTATISGAALTLANAANKNFVIQDGTAATDMIISAPIGEFGGSNGFTKLGDGTLELSGANTYTGTTTVNAGTLRLKNDAIDNVTARDYGPTAANATLEFNQTVGGSANLGAIDITGAGTFLKTGAEQLTLTSSTAVVDQTTTGLYHIADGIFQYGGGTPGDWTSNEGDMQIDGPGTFRGQSTAIYVDGLNGSGRLTIGGNDFAGDPALRGPGITVGVNGGNVGGDDFSGMISDATSGNQFSLTKVGSGTQILSGTSSNTYTGVTNVNDGTLSLNKSGGATAITGDVNIGDGTGSAASARLLLLGANQIASTSDVDIDSDGRFDLNGNNQAIRSLTGTGDVLLGGANLTLGSGGNSFTYNGTFNNENSNSTITIVDGTTFTHEQPGTGIAEIINVSGATDDLTFDVGTGAVADINARINNGGGDGDIVKEGAGELILRNNANNYKGSTFVNDGVLTVGADEALGGSILNDGEGTFVADGASLRVWNSVTVAAHEAIDLNGAGDTGLGANTAALLFDGGGTAGVDGDIHIATDATIGAFGGGTLTLGGLIDKDGTTVTFLGDGAATNTIRIEGGVTGASANSDLIVDAVTVVADSSMDYNGPTFIRNGGVLDIDPGAEVITTSMTVGSVGTGTVNHDTGLIEIDGDAGTPSGDLIIGPGTGTSGVYTLSGGELTFNDTVTGTQAVTEANHSTLTVGPNGTFNFDGGTLSNVTTIQPDGTLLQNGGNFVVGVDGGLDPDNAATTRATTNIEGNYTTMPGAALSIDIFGNDLGGGDYYPGTLAGEASLVTDLMLTVNDILTSPTASDLLIVGDDDGTNLGIADLTAGITLDLDTNGVQQPFLGYYDVLLADAILIDPETFAITGGPGIYRIVDLVGGGQVLQVATPEPATILIWTLIGAALFGGATWRRRRRQR